MYYEERKQIKQKKYLQWKHSFTLAYGWTLEE